MCLLAFNHPQLQFQIKSQGLKALLFRQILAIFALGKKANETDSAWVAVFFNLGHYAGPTVDLYIVQDFLEFGQ